MIRKNIVRSGEFYLVQTELNGTIWMRTALMNAMTDDHDLARLISAIRSMGQSLHPELFDEIFSQFNNEKGFPEGYQGASQQ